MDCDVAFVGAGPYALACSTYLSQKGIGSALFGEPMSFWRDHMPAGMYLRSNWQASHISDPNGKLTLDAFNADSGLDFKQPIPVERFVQYGRWFQQKAVPDLTRCQVRLVERSGSGFKLSLDTGETVTAKRVVVATGIAPFPWLPREWTGFPASLVSHSSDHADLSRFQGQDVLIVGGGQSGLDAARILHAKGARPELVAKDSQIRWVGEHAWLHHLGAISWCLYSKFDVGPAGISRLVGFPNLFRRLPRGTQDKISRRATRPAGTGWQKPYLEAVPIHLRCTVRTARMAGDKMQVEFSDARTGAYDHVIVATGYRFDLSRYRFLDPRLAAEIKRVDGHPVLARGFESSVPGIHFVGKPAAWSFGPLLNFISGTHFAGSELLRAF